MRQEWLPPCGETEYKRRGLMLVISSPSGAGKTTIARSLIAEDKDITLSISSTTRPPRPGEREGVDYNFISHDVFEHMVAERDFLEYAEVFGHRYGTPREPVEKKLLHGQDVLFDVDWQGARQLRQQARRDVVSVFVLPPSLTALGERLRRRRQDSHDVIVKRMAGAMREIRHWKGYDYALINENIEESICLVRSILQAERHRRRRRSDLAAFVTELLRAPPPGP